LIASTIEKDGGESYYRSGHGQFSHVQFKGMGQFGYNADDDPRFQIAFYNINTQAGINRKQSYVRGCAFSEGYNAGIGAQFNTHGLEITDNTIFGAPEDGIRILSDNCVVERNLIGNIFVRALWSEAVGGGLNDFDAGDIGAGIDYKQASGTILNDNEVVGVDGPCYHGNGEICVGKGLLFSSQLIMALKPKRQMKTIFHRKKYYNFMPQKQSIYFRQW
jgi:hypothetical protein